MSLRLQYLKAVEDWQAPFEVHRTLGGRRTVKTVAATLGALEGVGLVERHDGNNTFRLTEAGKAELASLSRHQQAPE